MYEASKYKSFYYKSKLDIDTNDEQSMRRLVLNFVEGLHWVLQYYHNGCPSWNW